MKWRGLLVVVSAILAAAGIVKAADDDKHEAAKLEGTWAAVSYVDDGQGEGETASVSESPVRWVFKGNNVSFLADVAKASAKGSLKLDPAAKPKTIDITFPPAADSKKSQTMLGIYEVERDVLKICYGRDGAKRPAEFKSKPKSSHIMVVFKRVKK